MTKKKIIIGLCIAIVGTVALVACGGGSSSPTATTINGITVPSTPDTTINNATLAGVDSNSNGLRDDAEIMIASLSKKDSYENYSFQLAKLEQRGNPPFINDTSK